MNWIIYIAVFPMALHITVQNDKLLTFETWQKVCIICLFVGLWPILAAFMWGAFCVEFYIYARQKKLVRDKLRDIGKNAD